MGWLGTRTKESFRQRRWTGLAAWAVAWAIVVSITAVALDRLTETANKKIDEYELIGKSIDGFWRIVAWDYLWLVVWGVVVFLALITLGYLIHRLGEGQPLLAVAGPSIGSLGPGEQLPTSNPEINQPSGRDEALQALSELYLRGVQLRNEAWNEPPDDDEAWWAAEVQIWIARVRQNMDRIHLADYLSWHTLGTVNMKSFPGVGINRPGLQHKLSMLTQLYEKLERYINERTRP